MPNVRQILAFKSTSLVHTVDASFTVHAAVALLANHGVGALVVTEGGKPVGIFSERDFARKGIIRGRRSHETPVSELMSAPLITVGPDHSMEDCMTMMLGKHIRHLPVEEDGQLIGMITIGDVLLQVVQKQQSMIDQLQGYITGKY